MTPSGWIIVGLGAGLALSLAGTAFVTDAYLGKRDELTKVEGQRAAISSAADACTQSVDGIRTAAAAQTKVALIATAAAKEKGKKLDAAADEILSTPATVPGDDCKSAQERAAAWLSRRAQK